MVRAQKVIIDTNLWISFLISKEFSWIDALIKNKKIEIIYSQELFDEIVSVLQRPKFKKYLDFHKSLALIALFENYFTLIEVTSEVIICRDKKDNFLLALAKDSNADYLLTGDTDLLILNPFERTKILTFSEFSLKLSN
ncbi:MAG TPA: putative toxin-antitoxin system toxin component, PIN family [Pelobium sp.]|nr:putative toxin-antitoxin system toxin component, PIN family [Pelobium sp.]